MRIAAVLEGGSVVRCKVKCDKLQQAAEPEARINLLSEQAAGLAADIIMINRTQ